MSVNVLTVELLQTNLENIEGNITSFRVRCPLIEYMNEKFY